MRSMTVTRRRKKKLTISRLYLFLWLLVPGFCLMLLLNASLPESTNPSTLRESNRMSKSDKALEGGHLGEFGEMMISMLPTDLAFTVFVPSDEAFRNTLGLRSNDSVDERQANDTYATISHVMGFSTAPLRLPLSSVPSDEIALHSVSGYILYVSKDSGGTLVVNNIKSKQVDIKRGELIIHVISGVLMDGEFEQSIGTDDDD